MVLYRVSLFGMAQATALAAGLVLHMVVARALSLGDYGRFVVACSVSLALLTLLMSAVPNALRRAVSVDPGRLRAAWRTVWLAQLPIGVLFAACLFCLAPLLAGALKDPLLAPVLALVAAELAVKAGLLEPAWHLLNGLGRHVLQASLMMGHSLLRLLCVVCVLRLSAGLMQSVSGLVLSVALSAVVVASVVQWLANRAPVRPDARLGRELLRWAKLAPGADALNYVLVAANLWVVKALTADPSLVGTYAACYVLTQAILPLSLVLSRGCFAPFAQALSNGRRDQASRLLSQATRLAVLVSAWGAVLAFLYGNTIVRLVYGSRFVVSGALLGLLSLGMFGMAMLWFFCEMLAAAGRLKVRLRLMAGVSAISLAVTVLMVRTWGPWGAAWALVISGSSGILAAGVLRRLIGAFIPWSTLLRATVAATAIIFIGRLGQSAFQGPTLLVGMLAASLGYLALLVMLHEWSLAKPQFAGRPLRSPPRSALSPLPKGEEYD